MDERIAKWLHDIRQSIEEIEWYFKGRSKNFADYKEDLMLRRAVERNLAIIGEAVNRILKRDPTWEFKIQSSKSIIGLRNQIIHGYDNISDENIWAVILTHVPRLKEDVERLLKE